MAGPVAVGDGRTILDRAIASEHRPDRPLESNHTLRLIGTRTWDESGNVLVHYAVGNDSD